MRYSLFTARRAQFRSNKALLTVMTFPGTPDHESHDRFPCMLRFVVFRSFKRGDEVMAGRVSRGPWNKCERGIFLLRLCRESLLTSCKPSTLEAGAGEGLIIPGRCLTASAGFGAEPQGLGRRVPRRCGGNEFGRRRTARRPSGTSSPWESTWRALSAVCLNTEQLLVGTCRKAVTTYLQGWL
jgi:hypothetical protein